MIKILLRILYLTIPFCIIFIYGLFFLPTTLDSNNMLYSSIDKRERLKGIEKPKMVFIAGSSMAFGLDSKVIEEQFNYPVVNMGIHAGIGLRYMILEAKPYLKKGDIVVIGAEYEQFVVNGTFYGQGTLPPLLFDIHKADYKKLDLKSTLYLFSQIVYYDLTKIRAFVGSEKKHEKIDTIYNKEVIENHKIFTTENVYARDGFNKYGDIMSHWNLEFPNHVINEKHTINLPSDEVFDFLSNFKKEMDNKGIKVIFVPPPYHVDCFKRNQKNIMKIAKKLEEYHLDYIAPPKRYSFADSLFFDTMYHLTKKGVDKRTQYLIEDISKYIQ